MTYIIKADHTLALDSYTEGQDINPLNEYTLEQHIKAHTPLEAVQIMYEDHLFQPFDLNNTDGHKLYTSHLVTADQQEPTPTQLKKWKQGTYPLYNLDINIAVYTYTKENLDDS